MQGVIFAGLVAAGRAARGRRVVPPEMGDNGAGTALLGLKFYLPTHHLPNEPLKNARDRDHPWSKPRGIEPW